MFEKIEQKYLSKYLCWTLNLDLMKTGARKVMNWKHLTKKQ